MFHRFAPAAYRIIFFSLRCLKASICTIEYFKYVIERREGRGGEGRGGECNDSSYSKDRRGTGFSEITPCSFFNNLLTRFLFFATPMVSLPQHHVPYRQHRLDAVVVSNILRRVIGGVSLFFFSPLPQHILWYVLYSTTKEKCAVAQ